MTSQLDRWLQEPTYDYTPDEIYDEVEGDAVASDVWDTLIESVLPALRRGEGRVLGGLVHTVGSDTYTPTQRKAIFLAVEQGFKEADVMRFTASAVLEAGSPTVFWGHTLKMIDHIRHAFGTGQDRVIEDYVKMLKQAHASWGKTGWVTSGDIRFGMGTIPYGEKLPWFEKVGGDFTCANQRLTSLKGCPREVGGVFFASDNKLESLEGGPEIVGSDYYCDNNKLKTLKGAPKRIPGEFLAYDNDLKDLRGAPSFVGDGFSVANNALRSLEGGPKHVGGGYNAENNAVLTSIEGVATYIDGDFTCDSANLKSLEPLLKSTVTMHVDTRFGYFDSWPPPEGTKLTASSENLPVSPPRVAAPSLKRWLKNPTYDWMPDEIEQDLEDNAQAEIWDILIEEVLPSLRKGNKRLLESYRHVAVGAAWSLNQVMAFLYAIHKGFKEKDILNFLSTVLVGEKIGHAVLYDTPLERYNDILFGRSTSNLTATYTVLDLLVAVGARWTPKGWVVPTTTGVHLSGLRLDALPLFHEVKGTFNCSNNRLTNLKGSPRKVGSEFDCSSNRLTTLDGCPLEVEDSFLALHNDKLKSIKALLKTKIGGVVFTDFGDFTTWPPSPSDPLSHVASISVEASRASEDRWFRDPSYEGAPPRINKILDEMSVEQEMWYEIIDTYVPALRAGKKATLDYLLRTYEQYDADQMKVILYAAEQGFKRSGEHVALAVNYMLYNPLMVAARIAEPAFKVDISKNSQLFNRLVGVFKDSRAHYTPQGWVVPDSLHIDGMGLVAVPPIASVKGDLFMQDNKLTSLEGCPRKVPGDFQCGGNKLTTLEGGPDWVGEDYYCYGNKLKDLRGAPSYVGNDFYAYHNPLKSLEGKPRHIGGLFEAE
jgi:hypothetical protein